MKKIAILLAATMAFVINSNAQSMQSGYKGHVDAGYSVGIGDYDFGRFEVNTTHGYQVNPYIFLGAGTGLHFMSSYKTGDMEIPLDVRDSKVIFRFSQTSAAISKKARFRLSLTSKEEHLLPTMADFTWWHHWVLDMH